MRSYSRARSIADQLAAGRQDQRQIQDAAHDLAERQSSVETSVSDAFEELRQHLGQGAEPTDEQQGAEYDAFDEHDADDAEEVPRFVANDEGTEAYRSTSRAVSHAVSDLKRRHRAAMWMPIWIFIGAILPVLAALGVVAYVSSEQSRIAVVDRMLGSNSAPASLKSKAESADIQSADRASDIAAPQTVAAYGEAVEATAPLDMASLIALSTPATESAALANLQSVQIPDAKPADVVAVRDDSRTATLATLSQLESAEELDKLPALLAALQGVAADVALESVQIAWAGGTQVNLVSPVPMLPRVTVNPSVANNAPIVLTPPKVTSPPQPTALPQTVHQPLRTLVVVEPIESRIVGSLRSTAARQAVPRVRPRPLRRPQADLAIVKPSVRNPAAQTPSVSSDSQKGSKPENVVVAVKRLKPRPEPQSSKAFLARQKASQPNTVAAAAKPAAPAPRPTKAADKPGIKAWEASLLFR